MKNKHLIFLFLISFLILKSKISNAQQIEKNYYKLNEFYKSSKFLKNTTCIKQDNNSIYWASTKNNIYYYNGNNFTPLNIKIPNCKDLFFDEKNNLWANTKNGYIILENIYSKATLSKKIKSIHITAALKDKNTVWYYEKGVGIIKYETDKNLKKNIKLSSLASINKETIFKIIIQKNNLFALCASGNIIKYNIKNNTYQFINNLTNKSSNFQSGIMYNNTIYFTSESNDMLCFDVLNNKYIEKNILKTNYNLIGISCLEIDNNNNTLLFGTKGQGIFIFNEQTNTLLQKTKNDSTLNLSNNYISKLNFDYNNNLLVSYDGNNFDIYSKDIKQFEKIKIDAINETYINAFAVDNNNNIWTSIYDKELLKIKPTSEQQFDIEKINLGVKKIDFIKHFNNQLYIINDNSDLIIYDISKNSINKEISISNLKNNEESICDIQLYNEKTILCSNYGNIYTLENDIIQFKTKIDKNFETENNKFNVLNSKLFICTEKGIYELKQQYNQLTSTYISSVFIKNIKRYNEASYITQNADSGMMLINKDFKPIKYILKEKNNTNYNLKDIEVIKNKIWTISENSILTISNLNEPSKEKIQEYNSITGFENYNFLQDGIIKINNTLLFVAEEGIIYSKYNVENEKNNKQEIIITNIEIFNQPLKTFSLFNFSKTYTLPFYDNSISIDFTTKNFSALPLLKFQYFLEGLNDKWIDVKNINNISFSNLSSGNYKLKIRTSDYLGNINNEFTTLEFKINAPFYYKWWFILGSLLLLTFIIYLIYKNKINNIKTEERIKSKFEKELATLEMTALRAQINPHFLFNSLNSINSFILKNENDKARKYLVRFSQLVRNILTHSSHNFITLEEEIKSLNLYLEIESMRFDNQFNYKIVIDKNVNMQTLKIPSMLLQPYVENAIWHGLIPKVGIKNLNINITIKEIDILEINIEDNGIGRIKSKEIAKKSMQLSQGISLGENRIKILNNEKATIKIIDLHSTADKNTGTKVTICLPINLK